MEDLYDSERQETYCDRNNRSCWIYFGKTGSAWSVEFAFRWNDVWWEYLMKKERRDRIITIRFGILIFVLSFLLGVASKLFIKPAWSKNYSVR